MIQTAQHFKHSLLNVLHTDNPIPSSILRGFGLIFVRTLVATAFLLPTFLYIPVVDPSSRNLHCL